MTGNPDSKDVQTDGMQTLQKDNAPVTKTPIDAAPRVRRSRARKLLFTTGTIVFLIGLFEVGSRTAHFLWTGTWDFLPVVRMASELYEAHPYLCYVMKPNVQFGGFGGQVRTNRWGFRGRDVQRAKPDGVVRIVCLGGSTTFSLNASDNHHTWPAQLERILNERHAPHRFEVLNFGTPGYCVVENCLTFALRGIDFSPDIVLIHNALNDVGAVFRPDVTSDYTHFRGLYTRLGGTWLGKSAVGRLVMLSAVRVDQPRSADRLTLSKEGVRLFDRYVESIVLLARPRWVEPVIVTMPDRLPHDDQECRRRSTEIGLTRLLNESLRRFSRRAKVSLIDLATSFPKDPALYTDDVHKTDQGLELLARMVADGLEEDGVVSRALERCKTVEASYADRAADLRDDSNLPASRND